MTHVKRSVSKEQVTDLLQILNLKLLPSLEEVADPYIEVGKSRVGIFGGSPGIWVGVLGPKLSYLSWTHSVAENESHPPYPKPPAPSPTHTPLLLESGLYSALCSFIN